METSSYLFLHCILFGSLWNHIFRWLGVSSIMSCDAPTLFNQFSFLAGAGKSRRSILQVIWFATVWEIWKERNNRVFNGKYCSILQVVDKIKSSTFMWLKRKHASLPLNFHGWWLSPFTILSIGYLLVFLAFCPCDLVDAL